MHSEESNNTTPELRACPFWEGVKEAGLSLDRFPETTKEAEVAEELLAREMETLTFVEQEKALFDVHGITPIEDEDADMVKAKLKELETLINQIKRKDAYEFARQQNAEYVESPAFRLMFLRCESFNVEAAAKMMVMHFEVKKKLFGDGNVLSREVLQSDLNAEDQMILESGFLQIMNTRDASGRTISLLTCDGVNSVLENDWDAASQARAMWYISMVTLKDEETQKYGTVLLIYNFHGYRVPIENYDGASEIELVIPNRMMGAHFCYNDPCLRPYVAGFQIFFNERNRYRLRTHFGSREAVNFELQTYGIPARDCPVGEDGSVSTDAHLDWLAMLKAQEAKLTHLEVGVLPEEFVVIPRKFDVLLGKDRMARYHTGTLRALHVVEMHYEQYEKLHKFEKTDLANTVIGLIHEAGGRFLKQNENGAWVVADHVESRNKVAHWFRHARAKQRSKQHGSKRPIDQEAKQGASSGTSESDSATS